MGLMITWNVNVGIKKWFTIQRTDSFRDVRVQSRKDQKIKERFHGIGQMLVPARGSRRRDRGMAMCAMVRCGCEKLKPRIFYFSLGYRGEGE